MKVDYIALSIPVFFVLIGVELLFGLKKKMKLYRLNDSITNIGLGVGQQVTGIFMKTALFFGYLFLYENYRFLTIEPTMLTWMALFFGVDFFYYWFHRMSHEINALWAAHIVHHQSEEYNLSVALRQSWFQNAFAWAFYLPLAFVGFDPIMFLTVSAFNTLYQFWIHTRTIGRLGPLEWILNTPSHHRVHHGSDPEYLDKNHGGTLIIWDRMFGTFQEELREPHYGITTPLKSWNPIWANFHYWSDLFLVASKTKGIGNKIKIFLKPPGWMPDDLGGTIVPKPIDDNTYQKYDFKSTKGINYYVFIQFVIILGVAIVTLYANESLSLLQLSLLSIYILVGLTICGGLFERRKWSVGFEITRLLITPALPFAFMHLNSFPQLLISGVVYFLVSVTIFLIQYSSAKSELTPQQL